MAKIDIEKLLKSVTQSAADRRLLVGYLEHMRATEDAEKLEELIGALDRTIKRLDLFMEAMTPLSRSIDSAADYVSALAKEFVNV